MAVDRIPGVGPTNADIATAVAAPSAATIATQVAASVPTLSQINTSVSNNASPYGGTWATLVNGQTFNVQTSVTFSGLTGYKYLIAYIKLTSVPSSSNEMYFRVNGDANNKYTGTMTLTSLDQTQITLGGNAGFGMDFTIEQFGANLSVPKLLHFKAYRASSGAPQYQTVLWNDTSATSSYTLFCNTSNFSGKAWILGAN
jgi:hypothetical protein